MARLLLATRQATALGGAMTGGVLWLGLVAPVLATRHVFEARTPGYFAVTAGYPLVGEVVMGAIVGTWHGKARR